MAAALGPASECGHLGKRHRSVVRAFSVGLEANVDIVGIEAATLVHQFLHIDSRSSANSNPSLDIMSVSQYPGLVDRALLLRGTMGGLMTLYSLTRLVFKWVLTISVVRSYRPPRPRCRGHRGRGVQATTAEISDAPLSPRSMAVHDHSSHQHTTVPPLVGRLGGPKPL